MVRLTLFPDHKTLHVTSDDGQVERDILSGHISKVGDVTIEYDLLTGYVTRVGAATVDYDAMIGNVSKVTGTIGDSRIGLSA